MRLLGGMFAVAAMLVAVLVIVALGRRDAALVLPTSIDGLPRMQGPGVEALTDQMRVRVMQPGSAEALVAAYGESRSPAFVLLVRDADVGGLTSFENAYIRGLTSGLSGPAALRHLTRDGIGFDCATVRTETTTPLSFCLFDDGRALGAGLVADSASLERALRLTGLGRQGTEGG
jgi:hypothetical protein